MAASVKIEFDDGSRVISQTLEDVAEVVDPRIAAGRVLSVGNRPASCSIDDFYEDKTHTHNTGQIPRTTAFIADGNFRRVALQFPDALLREAPEVLWTLQARLRKLAAGGVRSVSQEGREEEGEGKGSSKVATTAPPLIFVTGDTSYGSCCVDEVSAQHLKADAIIHYGRACLSPTNSSVPVLYVFGRGDLDVQHLASTLLSGPLSATAAATPVSSGTSSGLQGGGDDLPSPPTAAGAEGGGSGTGGMPPPVLLLYDVSYAYAIPALLEILAAVGGGGRKRAGLVVGFPTTEAYSPMTGGCAKPAAAGYGCGATSTIGQGGGSDRCGQSDRGPPCTGDSRSSEKETTGECCGRSGGNNAGCGTGGRGTGHPSREGALGGQGGAGPREPSEPSAVESGASSAPRHAGGAVSSLPSARSSTASGGLGNPGLGTPSTPETDTCTSGQSVGAAPGGEVAALPTAGPPAPLSCQQKRRVRIGGLGVNLESEEELRRHTLVFVGGEGRQLSNVLMRCAGCVDRMRYDPCLPPGDRVIGDTRKGNKDLMRRYYLVQRAREAGVIGIVVGTLGVQRYGSVVRSVRKMIEDAGRKAYTLAVGKVNVAKLANFAEVDVFCLVACAENSLLDSREFHAPVVTPLELEVALRKREWDGFYSTDFDDLLELDPPASERSGAASLNPTVASDGIESLAIGDSSPTRAAQRADDDEGDEPFFSLVTGTYQNKPGVSRKKAEGHHTGAGGSAGALVGVGDRSLVEWSSPAADFLGKREFKGLEALVGQTEAKAATPGQSGIASDYGGV
ncbi:unnamed protein product [Ectocarpus sp. CCAP 1310/34]|nr:unnamed protein product [Ectocarpus sp. CCAP 1310/34]